MAELAGMEDLITAQITTYQHLFVGAARPNAIVALASPAYNLQSDYSACKDNVMADPLMQVLRQ